MFKPRSAAASAAPPSVELVRQRAKHRLMGVSVLVLAAVVLFPLLFDTQPRPIPVDIPIEIPSRKTAKPLTVEPVVEPPAAQVAASAPPGSQGTAPPSPDAPSRAVADDEEVIISQSPARAVAAPAGPAAAVAVKPPAAKPEAAKAEPMAVKEAVVAPLKDAAKDANKEPAKPAPVKEAAKEPARETAKEADAARAQALLEGKLPPSAAAKPVAAPDAAGARFIVQVGAFADSAVAQSARLKLERAGLKTYTHEAQTPEGKRIRVRLGPFATRAEAEKAAAKAKAAGTAAAILTL